MVLPLYSTTLFSLVSLAFKSAATGFWWNLKKYPGTKSPFLGAKKLLIWISLKLSKNSNQYKCSNLEFESKCPIQSSQRLNVWL